MGIAYNPKIITDGLVLCLDAANTKSYPGTGTAWNDLSLNKYIGTLINGASFSQNKIVLDGVDDYIAINNPASLNPGSTSFSIDCWIYQKDTGFNSIVEARGANLHGFLYTLNYSSAGYASFFLNTTLNADQNIYYSSVLTFSDTMVWINVAVVIDRSNETITFYKNGVRQGTSVSITSGGTADPGSGHIYHIGGDLGGPESNIDIANYKHYNRPLTEQEIKQNFNATRGRFGV